VVPEGQELVLNGGSATVTQKWKKWGKKLWLIIMY
jgi:hypothetical protein